MRERVYEVGTYIHVHSAVRPPSIQLFVHCCASETDRVKSLLLTIERAAPTEEVDEKKLCSDQKKWNCPSRYGSDALDAYEKYNKS